MEKLAFIYEGKAKQVYATEEFGKVIIHYKDDATAFNGLKKGSITNKGILNNEITERIFQVLHQHHIATHFIARLNDRDQLCHQVAIIPLEVIVRNVIAGSMAKRLNIEEGTIPSNVIYEICYKNDALDDPLINDHHAVALGIVTYQELDQIYAMTKAINEVLLTLFSNIGIDLVDFKIEFGKTLDGSIVLADEISCDTCRLWDSVTKSKLDKDRFRRGLDDVEGAYHEILKRLREMI